MSLTMRYLPILILFLIQYSCSNRQQDKISLNEDEEECIFIDVEECLKSKKEFSLSTISDTIEYLKLTTPKSLIITKIRKVVMYRSNFFLKSNHCIYKFSRNGEFVCQIGNRGKGPGEYSMAMDFFIDSLRDKVGITHYPYLSFYNTINGEYVNTIEFKYPDADIQDSIILGSAETFGIEKYKMIGLNYDLDTLLSLPNHIFYHQSDAKYGSMKTIREEYYNYDGNTFYKGYEEYDTVWKIDDMRMVPHIYFDMGKYKLPFEYECNVSPEKFQSNANKYKCVPRVEEDKDYIFFNINFREGGGIIDHCALYIKSFMQCFTVYGYEQAGIKDDLLFGPDVWPMHINNKYFISYIEPYVLIDYCNRNQQLIHDDLKDLIQELSESSNQLLILCRKKKI